MILDKKIKNSIYLYIYTLLAFSLYVASESQNFIASLSTILYLLLLVLVSTISLNKLSFYNPLFMYCFLQLSIFVPNWIFFIVDLRLSNDTFYALNTSNIEYYILEYNILNFIFLLFFTATFLLIKRFCILKSSYFTIPSLKIINIASFFIFLLAIASFYKYTTYFESLIQVVTQREISRSDRVVSDIGRHWSLLSQLGLVSIVLLIFTDRSYLQKKLFWFYFLVNVIIIFAVSGNRTSIALSFLLVIFGQFFHHGKILNVKIILVSLIAFLSISVVTVFRDTGVENTFNQNYTNTSTDNESFLQRFIEIRSERAINGNSGLGVLAYTDIHGFVLGDTYSSIPYIFIPSFFIDYEKPFAAGRYTAKALKDRNNTAWPIGAVIESYFNFGIIGVVIVAIFYGYLSFLIYKLIIQNKKNPIIVSIFFVFILFFSPGSDGLYKSLPLLIPLFIILLFTRFKFIK